MSSDPLARWDIWTGAPNEAEYDAVYAAVMATERGRWFLTEYAIRNRQADTQALVGAVARIEAAIRNDRPAQSQAPSLGRNLIEMAAAIQGIRAAIRTERARMSDLSAATDRIQDIAFSLRERAGDPTLCDALDAAAREISDAARSSNGGDQSQIATDLLRDLAGRIDMIALSLAENAVSNSIEPSTAASPAATTVPSPGEAPETASKPKITSGNDELPPIACKADAEPSRDKADVRRPRWYIEPPEFAFAPTKQSATPSRENRPARGLLPETQLLPGPQDDPAELFEPAEAAGVRLAARITARPGSPDPLAGVRALSEEEVIALFS